MSSQESRNCNSRSAVFSTVQHRMQLLRGWPKSTCTKLSISSHSPQSPLSHSAAPLSTAPECSPLPQTPQYKPTPHSLGVLPSMSVSSAPPQPHSIQATPHSSTIQTHPHNPTVQTHPPQPRSAAINVCIVRIPTACTSLNQTAFVETRGTSHRWVGGSSQG